ncbi:MAG: NAD-dependent epimerase/dehydratase family protein [candidate division WS1 bacterium]|jgi:dTDP-glucose 4,6-dehydratase|nr:NAD-dependent epimerase/dehydratase family protein [candidate division WS1 bacterium]
MKVLIIGGTRYLGREIMMRLAERGDEVTLLNRGRTECALPDNVDCLTADIMDPDLLVEALEGDDGRVRTFDTCVHMIAMDGARAERVIEAVWGLIGHYVQCGSTGVFMPLQRCPADESEPVAPPPPDMGGFGSKAESDQVARELCAQYDLPLTILRPTNIMGPGDVPIDLLGGRDAEFFQGILDGEPIIIPNHGDGLLQPGDVRDLADAFVLAVDQPDKAGEYNISSPYAITHNYYAQLLADAMDVEAQGRHVPVDEIIEEYAGTDRFSVRGIRFFAEHMCFTIEKARRELGYEPQYTAEASVEQTVRWMFDNNVIMRD